MSGEADIAWACGLTRYGARLAVPVDPGSSTVTTADFRVPGDYKLVDHALSRVVRKGCLAVLRSVGPENPTLFDPQ